MFCVKYNLRPIKKFIVRCIYVVIFFSQVQFLPHRQHRMFHSMTVAKLKRRVKECVLKVYKSTLKPKIGGCKCTDVIRKF